MNPLIPKTSDSPSRPSEEEIAKQAAAQIVQHHRAGFEWEVGKENVPTVQHNIGAMIIQAFRASRPSTTAVQKKTDLGEKEARPETAHVRQKWSPIESAPTNTSVLVFIPNAEHYGHGVYRALRPKFGILRPWQVTGLHMGRDCGPGYQPTHWMSLPDSPEESEADSVGRGSQQGEAPLSETPASPAVHSQEEWDCLVRTNAGHMDELQKAFDQVKLLAKRLEQRPHIHNKKMLDAIEAVIIEHSGNGLLAEEVRAFISAASPAVQKDIIEKQFAKHGWVQCDYCSAMTHETNSSDHDKDCPYYNEA